MEQMNEKGNKPLNLAQKLFTAINSGKIDDAEKYLNSGADPNYILPFGVSSFHFASGCPHSYDFIEMILRHNGNPNIRNSEGITPLHVAAQWGKTDCVKLLIEHGADVNIKDNEGSDVRWFARDNGSPACISMVEEMCANQRNNDRTPKTRCPTNSDDVFFTPKLSQDSPYRQRKISEEDTSVEEQPISIRSPLHSLCDDSWVLKRRGSSSKRRLNSDRTAKENCPKKSPKLALRTPPSNASSRTCRNILQHYDQGCFNCNNERAVVTCCGPPVRTCGTVNHSCHNNCRRVKVPTCHDCLETCHGATPSCCAYSCHSALVKREENNNMHRGNALNTSDKCIGTSFIDPAQDNTKVSSTDSVACQVSSIHYNDASCEGNGVGNSDIIQKFNLGGPEDDKTKSSLKEDNLFATGHMVEKDGSSTSGARSSSDHAAMEQFIKGCDGFLQNDSPKGLDVSSPDHCISFALDKKGDDPKHPCICPSVSKNTPNHESAKCDHCPNKNQNDVYKSVKIHDEIINDGREKATEISDSVPSTPKLRTSPLRNMLFSTKVPLTPSEMEKLYGRNIMLNDRVKQTNEKVESNKGNQTQSSLCGKGEEKCDLSSSSDATVIYEANDTTVDSQNSTLITSTKDTIKRSQTSPKAPFVEDCNMNLKTVNLVTGKKNLQIKPAEGREEKSSHRISSPSGISPDSTIVRLHSTALPDSRDRVHKIDDASFNISLIKEDSEIRLHTDEEGNSWLEHHTPVNLQESLTEKLDPSPPLQLSSVSSNDSSNQSTVIYNWKTFWKGEPLLSPSKPRTRSRKKQNSSSTSGSSSNSADEDISTACLENMTNNEIREKLLAYGYTPGPIGANRNLYLRRLKKLMKTHGSKNSTLSSKDKNISSKNVSNPTEPKFSSELNVILSGGSLPDSVVKDDESICAQFEQPDLRLRWREGTAKNSFTYLLLDPRVTNKLPSRAKDLSELEAFTLFVGAIFYIGKGKKSRPFSHFHEALETNVMHYKLNPSRKIRHIHDIWADGYGVVSLHVFQSVIACEAYTREAAMIDAIGLTHLTNRKRGEYYGPAASWDLSRKRTYGVYLVMKAMKVLMADGERQIRPADFKTKNASAWTTCQSRVTRAQN